MTASSERVDVIIASNRPSPYLPAALESLRAQTYPLWHLIIVDDGSPDPAYFDSLCATIPDATCLHLEAGGVSSARNAGIRAGSSPLLAFLDDDDIWHPERLALQVEALDEDPLSVASYSGGWFMDANGQTFGEGWSAESASSAQFLSGEVNTPRFGTLLVRRTALDRVGSFNKSLSFGEDDDFILRLAQLGEMAPVDKELFGYRRHQFNTTNAPAYVRRRSSERLLKSQIRMAQERKDTRVESLLRENLQRYRVRAAGDCVGSLVSGVKGRNWSLVRAEVHWAATVAPFRTVRAAIARGWAALGRKKVRP